MLGFPHRGMAPLDGAAGSTPAENVPSQASFCLSKSSKPFCLLQAESLCLVLVCLTLFCPSFVAFFNKQKKETPDFF